MARKPLDQLSPAYRRRIERAEAKGLTRQAARGHKTREHVRRAEYQRKQNKGLTTPQKRAIANFYENPAYTQKQQVKLSDLEEYARRKGYEQFQKYRAAWKQANAAYKKRGYQKGRLVKGASGLVMIAAQEGSSGGGSAVKSFPSFTDDDYEDEYYDGEFGEYDFMDDDGYEPPDAMFFYH